MSHRVLNVSVWLACSIAAFESWVQAADRRPNVVLIVSDDLGYMDIGANNPRTFYETPNIDRLAREGMRFTQGYANCPVCSPTRASIMTGKYPQRTGITDFIGGRTARQTQARDESGPSRFGGGHARRAAARRRLRDVLCRQVASGRGEIWAKRTGF